MPACTTQDLPSRPRRNRRSPAIRGAISETHISPANLILPVFIHDGEQNIPIASMPGVDRLGWRHGLLDSVAEARSVGVNSVVLFPKVLPPLSLWTLAGPACMHACMHMHAQCTREAACIQLQLLRRLISMRLQPLPGCDVLSRLCQSCGSLHGPRGSAQALARHTCARSGCWLWEPFGKPLPLLAADAGAPEDADGRGGVQCTRPGAAVHPPAQGQVP